MITKLFLIGLIYCLWRFPESTIVSNIALLVLLFFFGYILVFIGGIMLFAFSGEKNER